MEKNRDIRKALREKKAAVVAWIGRYINGTKGVISLFLAILMVPFVLIAGVLINAGRINSAVAIFDEALCNASNSTLGTYDTFLRTRFGLLAISQDYPKMGIGYTAENFLADTFSYYMEQNCQSLSNTFSDISVSASGVYPLADTDVLLSQVMENGKYSVPMQLVIDGFNLDDILGNLTNKLSLWSDLSKVSSSVTDTVVAYDDLQEKFEKLTEEIDACTDAYTAYVSAYSEFKTAVDDYNSLIDQRNNAVQQCENAITNAQNEVNTRQTEFDAVAEKYQSIIDELNELKNEKDSEGNPVDNSAEIQRLEGTFQDELEEYRTAEANLKNAENQLSAAQTDKQDTINYYDGLLAGQRTTIADKRDAYVPKISELMVAVQSMNSAISGAQSAASTVISKGSSSLTGVVTIGFDLCDQSEKNDIEDLKAQREAADKEGNTELVKEYDAIIAEIEAENKENKTKRDDIKKGVTSGTDDLDAVTKLEDFAESTEYYTKLNEIYSQLQTLKANVSGLQIPTNVSKIENVTSYIYYFDFPVSTEYVEGLLDGLLQQVISSSVLTALKGIVGFITAIFEMFTELGYDHDLVSKIDTKKYEDIGGLPSTRGQESYKSAYADADKEKSDENKAALGDYSSSGSAEDYASLTEIDISVLMDNITICNEAFKAEWNVWTFIGLIKTICNAVSNIWSRFVSMAAEAAQMSASAMEAAYSKILLVGYIGYNTSNRTTYKSGTALTGSSFALPDEKDPNANGYAFYGAETEYILFGQLSEIGNQRRTYYSILALRCLFDLFIVCGNAEIQAIATAAGAVSFGVLYYVVLLLWSIAEGFMDTVILCHGGSIRYVKTHPFLSIEGIPDLVKSITALSLTKAMKEKIKDAASDSLNKMTNRVDDPEKRAKINSAFYEKYTEEQSSQTNEELNKLFTYNYTKMLLVYMLFKNSETLLLRLSDIIQMEATWYGVEHVSGYTFDLGKSYTYLRASGSFRSNQFIKISKDDLLSTERIVYRGY